MIDSDGPVTVVGAGQAGSQFAISLRESGHRGPITLVGDEKWVPYQRPPLSKSGNLTRPFEAHDVQLRSPESYERAGVELRRGEAVVGIDRDRRRVALATGEVLSYAHLVLATGTRPRPLAVPGADLRGVHYLRTLEDANRVRPLLAESASPVVIGGGLIGLELAAAAACAGRPVTVVEAAERTMAPAVCPVVATYVERMHASRGNHLLCGCVVVSLDDNTSGGVAGVVLSDGRRLPADLVVVAVGVEPITELAAQVGLQLDNGIVVDRRLRTDDDCISAIGDCANFPDLAGRRTRLESVQNAVDQARFLAGSLSGADGAYRVVPWFWSNQFDLKLQFAGLGRATDECVVREGPTGAAFSVFRFAADELVRVESVNCPLDHVAARRVLARPCCRPDPVEVRRAGFSLRHARTCAH
ncbi:MAG TPA: FAD-dependent oxidoreductase [Pseudonocardia sp.]|jgi:3-phenylpropionate/trans-cinnamate dioxygenase ferredoxin reductase subunit|nr:FAD-dependent oxidoreductase [Pseudonocardia sp.]